MENKDKKLTSKRGGRITRGKRLPYRRMPEGSKIDLIFRVLILEEKIQRVCRVLGFNCSTARNIIHTYKKTGQYEGYEKLLHDFSFLPSPVAPTENSNETESICPLGITLFEDNNIRLVSRKTYTLDNEKDLMNLHIHLQDQIIKCKDNKIDSSNK